MNTIRAASAAETKKAGPNRTEYFLLGGLLGLSILPWWAQIVASVQLALSSDAYTYILLILPLSLSLIYFEGRSILRGSGPNRLFGVLLLTAALAMRATTEWNTSHFFSSASLSLGMAALVGWWIGSVIFCFGFQTFQSLAFPLCFLFLIVPMPDRALAWSTAFLQQQSAWGASALFGLFGVPVTRDGIILSIPGLTIEVAHECSSIRSSTILIVMTLLLAHLFLRSGWSKTLLVLAAVPLSALKNAIRIFTIAELGTRVNPSFLHGSLHRHGGPIFLGLAVLMIIALLWIFRRTERRVLPLGYRGLQ
jgi:exosortase